MANEAENGSFIIF